MENILPPLCSLTRNLRQTIEKHFVLNLGVILVKQSVFYTCFRDNSGNGSFCKHAMDYRQRDLCTPWPGTICSRQNLYIEEEMDWHGHI